MTSSVRTPREVVLLNQGRLFRKLLQSVWQKSAFYREYYTGHGIREHHLGELPAADLPVITKQVLMDNFDRAVTDTRLRKSVIERWLNDVRDPRRLFYDDLIVIHGSGSSGTVGTFVYSRVDWNAMNGVMAARLPRPENYPDKTRVAYYCVSHGHTGGVSTALQLGKAIYDVLIVSALDAPERVIDQLQRFQPHRLTGHSSGIAALAEWAAEGKLRIHPRRIFAIGDLMTPAMEQKIRGAWGAPILNHYGASESLFLAVKDDEDDVMAIMDDLNVLEIVDEDNQPVSPGETGRVVISNLYNYTLPVIRYELGDYVVKGDALASGFGSIRSIRPGKSHELLPITLDDGRCVNLPAAAMTSFYASGLERAQFISRHDRIEIVYVANQNIDREVSGEFGRILSMKGASRMAFTVRRVPFIAPDPITAKVRLVVLEKAPAVTQVEKQHDPAVTAKSSALKPDAFEKAEIEGSLVSRFERQVEQHGDRMAIKSGDCAVTYGELNRASNRIAQMLLARSGEKQEAIALLLEPGINAVTAIFGVLKAGKFYVPLDPNFPHARLAAIVQDAEPSLLLTDNVHFAAATSLTDDANRIVNIESLDQRFSDSDPRLTIAPGAYSYLLYTSGSTGQPKGVIHNHRSVLHQIAVYTKTLSLCAEDRVTFLHSHCFSASRLDIFGALLNGAGLFHYDVATQGPARLARWLNENEITVFQWLPTAFRHFAGALSGAERFPNLRLMMLGSEPLLKGDVELYRRHFAPGCVLLNRFATTETGTIALHFIDENTQLESSAAPIGRPIEDTEVLLLDERGDEVGPGEIGEITVRSTYLSPGYWRRPELTRAAFTTGAATDAVTYRTGDMGHRLPDGCLMHAGRKDFQTKIRGHRVEINETEGALLTHPAIREAAVVVSEEQPGDERLVAYMTPHNAAHPTASTLRSYLAARLPAQMVPSAFIWLQHLPLNPNGKLDRLALSQCAGTSAGIDSEFTDPRTPIERALVQIWRKVLDVPRVGIHDNFFDLGGQSLSAAQVLTRVVRVFAVEIPVRDFFESPTIANLAKLIMSDRTKELDAELVDLLVGTGFMSEDETSRLLAEIGDH